MNYFLKLLMMRKKKGERARTNFDPKIIEFAIRNKLQNKSAEEIYQAYVKSKEDAAQAEMDAFYGAAPEPEPEQEAGRVEKAAAAAAEGFKKFMGSLTRKAELKSKKRRKTRKRKSKKKRSKKRKRSSRKSKTKRRR